MEPIILASGSLQRQEYLKLLGIPFSIMPSLVTETIDSSWEPEEAAKELAFRKVNQVIINLANRCPPWVLGADTLISLNGEIFGKPKDREDAYRMLSGFQGQSHDVITGVAFYNHREKKLDKRCVTSKVWMASLRQEEIEWYLDTGEWQGVAGAYRIQGLAACFITDVHGSFSSIAGLPLHEFYVMLKESGYPYGDAQNQG